MQPTESRRSSHESDARFLLVSSSACACVKVCLCLSVVSDKFGLHSRTVADLQRAVIDLTKEKVSEEKK